ncbi:MAG: hypothetical protein CMA34_00925 [Euryarchaeota archaeon]|jgi:ribulose-5-phosphate 4-epimerase/fuculose-1-phosphate aldolase|nr:hypothetical protein [Euryarchaeota archaeon]
MVGPTNSRRKKKVKVDEVDEMLAGAFGMGSEESEERKTSKIPKLPPSGPPGSPPSSGPPSKGPPSGPPGSPPSSGPPSKGPPSGPPSSPPSKGPSSGPPSSGPPSKGPPSGPPGSPPSSGPPSGPPGSPPSEDELEEEEEFRPPSSGPPSGPPGSPPSEDELEEETADVSEVEAEEEAMAKITKMPIKEDEGPTVEVPTSIETFVNPDEIENLRNEVERLRSGLASAGEVISEIEEVPTPPIVGPDYVVAGHIVSDFIRTGRLLHREKLVRAAQGSISLLDPDEPGLVHASKSGCMLGRILEGDIVTGRLGQSAPENAPDDWRIHEVMLAFASLQYEGPAACIYAPSSHAIALSLDKKLIKMEPVDEIGKQNFGKAIIVDPNYDNMDDFLRQITDAMRQGNGKAACIRGVGVYAVGRNFDEAWNNCAILEHSSEIILLSRN